MWHEMCKYLVDGQNAKTTKNPIGDPMRCFLFAVLSLTAPLGAFALTWDFDDGFTWGWTARESASFSNTHTSEPLHSEIVDGVWRIAPVPGRRPTVQLRSPWIGEDSALFDRLTLRLRLMHHSPTEGAFLLYWSNAVNRGLSPPDTRGVFGTGRPQSYPIEWEDITIDLRALAADPKWKITWQDTLFIFRIDMELYRDSQDVDNHPKFLEIDSIQLTGAEELAQGELAPRDLDVELEPPGTLFAESDFFPLGGTIDFPGGYWEDAQGVMGDVDGDGDADLVVLWTRLVDGERQQGWTVASNDGLGGFEPTQEVILSTYTSFFDSFSSMDLWGSDFDGDGLLDLAVGKGVTVGLWYNWGGGFDPTLQLSDVKLVGLADGDGDGNVDLLVSDTASQVSLWTNDGYDFIHSDTFVLDSEDARVPYLPAGQPLGKAASLLWRRPCYQPQDFWQLTRPWAAIEEPPLSFEAVVNPCDLHLITDLDGDGTVDLLGSPERTQTFFGIVNRMDASGEWIRHSLLDWKALSPVTTASDVNGDGVLDVAMVAGNSPIGPALVVLLGQPNGAPVLEGYYSLPGEGNQVLAGDVNGDGDTDLVVLGTSPASNHGGVFVLINQGTPATAIASEVAATPTTFALGVNYPNPFNPATTIPLAVPVGAKNVDLTIYNILGQPMRQVWTGPLSAGEHELTWDGRDAQGQPVATGVYVYRLQVDEQTRTRKMVKLE